jgi:hypothetical protein
MRVPHRDNVPRFATRCPHQHNHPTAEVTCSDEANLTAFSPVRRTGYVHFGEDLHGIGKIKTSFPQRFLALRGIERDLHQSIMYIQ